MTAIHRSPSVATLDNLVFDLSNKQIDAASRARCVASHLDGYYANIDAGQQLERGERLFLRGLETPTSWVRMKPAAVAQVVRDLRRRSPRMQAATQIVDKLDLAASVQQSFDAALDELNGQVPDLKHAELRDVAQSAVKQQFFMETLTFLLARGFEQEAALQAAAQADIRLWCIVDAAVRDSIFAVLQAGSEPSPLPQPDAPTERKLQRVQAFFEQANPKVFENFNEAFGPLATQHMRHRAFIKIADSVPPAELDRLGNFLSTDEGAEFLDLMEDVQCAIETFVGDVFEQVLAGCEDG